MGNKYLIKEAAKMVDVEPHVLRYWEEELDMRIKRNDMGHRYYDEQDIRILKKIKELKDRGIQLKAIHELVQKMYDILENGVPVETASKEVETDSPRNWSIQLPRSRRSRVRIRSGLLILSWYSSSR